MAKKQGQSIIDQGMVITGTVTCSGALEVHGQIQGDVHCRSLTLAKPGHIHGDVLCESVAVDSRIDGSIRSRQVVLRSEACVIGDIHHASLTIESGAFFEGEVRRSENPTEVKSSPPQIGLTQPVAHMTPAEHGMRRPEPRQHARPDHQIAADHERWRRTG